MTNKRNLSKTDITRLEFAYLLFTSVKLFVSETRKFVNLLFGSVAYKVIGKFCSTAFFLVYLETGGQCTESNIFKFSIYRCFVIL